MQCDGKVPSCTQCLHTRRECGGYQYDFIFLHHKPPKETKTRGKPKRLEYATRPSRQASIPPAIRSKEFRSEASCNLIIQIYAPWLIPSTEYSSQWRSSHQICGSWVGVLPKMLEEAAPHGVLAYAVFTLALSIQSKEAELEPPSSACMEAHCKTLELLRQSLAPGAQKPGPEVIAASMCLTLAEVREGLISKPPKLIT